MPKRSRAWVWTGRVIFLAVVVALAGYLAAAGLDKADKTASSIAAVLALLALGAPYLLPSSSPPPSVTASAAGSVAIGGDSSGEVSTEVSGTVPDASPAPPGPGVTASGTGSVAVGGASAAPISTRVTDTGDGRRTTS